MAPPAPEETMMKHMFDDGLERREANYVPLTPIDFLVRAAEVYGERVAIVHGAIRRNWRDVHERSRRLASALRQAGIERGDTVAVLLPNIPPMIEAHFGVPMAGAVLNALNTRLDVSSLLFMLRHGEAKALIVDTEFAEFAHRAALEFPALTIISVADVMPADPDAFVRATDYEAFLQDGDPAFAWDRTG
jgi:fatty-acyl-CoA synthase